MTEEKKCTYIYTIQPNIAALSREIENIFNEIILTIVVSIQIAVIAADCRFFSEKLEWRKIALKFEIFKMSLTSRIHRLFLLKNQYNLQVLKKQILNITLDYTKHENIFSRIQS